MAEPIRSIPNAVVRWLLLAGLAVWLVIGLRSPTRLTPLSETAGATEFSAERAMKHVYAIAQKPHPVGSAEHDRVRDYIRAQFTALGVDPAVQSGIGTFRRQSS